MIEAIAQRTAQIVLERLQGNKPQQAQHTEGRWGNVAAASQRMGLKSERALWERKQGNRIPQHLYRKFGGSVMWDLHAIDKYMASLPSD
jgi:hypothetical protein